MISRYRLLGVVLFALTVAQFVSAQSDFMEINTAEKLIEEYEHPTVIGVGLLVVCGFVVSLMTFFRSRGWRVGVIIVVVLYVWSVWYPDFLHLVFKYGASTVIAGIYDNARAAGTLGLVLLHKLLYPLGYFIVLLAALWDLKAPGGGD